MASSTVDFQYDILYLLKEHFAYGKTALSIPNDVIICDERTYSGLEELDRNAIYVIVAFEKGTIFSGSTIIPLSCNVLSEKQTYNNARKLISWVALTYNLNAPSNVPSGSFVRELYTTSDMVEAFEEDGNNYRARFEFNGTFVFGFNIAGITNLIIDEDESDTPEEQEKRKITFLEIEEEVNAIPHTANIGLLNDRTQTINTATTYTITFTMIPQKDQPFTKKVLDFMHDVSTSVNATCSVVIEINGVPYSPRTMHIISVGYKQEIASVPVLAITLGE